MKVSTNLTVILRNLTPYHSSSPEKAKVDLNGKFVRERGFPVTLTRMMGVPAMFAPADSESLASGVVRVPIMPANSLRHQLREFMLDSIFARFIKQDVSLSTPAYAAALSGNVSGNPEGVPADFAERAMVAAHPFLGLFGGGPRMITGKLSVDNSMVLTPDTLMLLGEEHQEHVVNLKGYDLTQVEWLSRKDPIKRGGANDDVIAGGPQAITDWCSNAQDFAENEEDNTRGLDAFNATQVVRPGMPWVWRVTGRKLTPAQKGLLLAAIKEFNGSELGGKHNIGFGRMRIESVLLDGRPIWSGGSLNEHDPEVAESISAWLEALETLEVEDFEAFARSTKKEASVDKKKAGVRGKKASDAQAAEGEDE